MNIQENVSLASHSTMRLGGMARYLTEVTTASELKESVEWATKSNLPVITIGEGSNIVWTDKGFQGLVIVNKILGYELQQVDDNNAMIIVGAGENWDHIVEQTVNAGFYTLAPLSLIPGTVGATPIQNVGAYGQEVSSSLVTVQAYDTKSKKIVNLMASDCEFSYRTSKFKTTAKGRYHILSVTFSISKTNNLTPYYDGIDSYLAENNLAINSAQDLRNAVVAIRSAKLPDPNLVANNGSFFANPVIGEMEIVELRDKNPTIKYWHLEGGKVKVSAAWLIEQAGFKDFHDKETGMGTWPSQPLVLVNEKAKNTEALIAFRDKIISAVQQKFNITLEQEPELI